GRAPADPWLVTLASLRKVAPDLRVVVGATESSTAADLDLLPGEHRGAATPAVLVNDVFAAEGCHVLLVTAPVVFPPEPLRSALELADGDLRCASVSFLCNAAAFLSFPHRDAPSIHQIDDLDEVSITRRLRAMAAELEPVPVPY